jgi:hypothetical protein
MLKYSILQSQSINWLSPTLLETTTEAGSRSMYDRFNTWSQSIDCHITTHEKDTSTTKPKHQPWILLISIQSPCCPTRPHNVKSWPKRIYTKPGRRVSWGAPNIITLPECSGNAGVQFRAFVIAELSMFWNLDVKWIASRTFPGKVCTSQAHFPRPIMPLYRLTLPPRQLFFSYTNSILMAE